MLDIQFWLHNLKDAVLENYDFKTLWNVKGGDFLWK